MSAAPGTEALDVPAPSVSVRPEALAVRHRTVAFPPRPTPLPVAEPEPPTTPADWVVALRLHRLPVSLLGAAVALPVAVSEPVFGPGAAAAAVAGSVVVHLLAALVQALADPRRHRAGPLRRVEAGRALLGAVAAGLVVAVVLAVALGPVALLLVAAGVVAVSLRSRPALPHGTTAVCVAVSCAATWVAATGTLPWQVLPAALVAGVLTHALRSTSTAPWLLVAPCVAVGAAVALHALPWPALLVALSLPAARRAAAAGQAGTLPARTASVLLLVGLAGALLLGVDLPLSATR